MESNYFISSTQHSAKIFDKFKIAVWDYFQRQILVFSNVGPAHMASPESTQQVSVQ
jgi:hypothetical protein